jgi:hypothetical protein
MGLFTLIHRGILEIGAPRAPDAMQYRIMIA